MSASGDVEVQKPFRFGSHGSRRLEMTHSGVGYLLNWMDREELAMVQQNMSARVREVSRTDDRLAGVLMFGSLALGEGDAFSDIELTVFIRDDAFELLNQREWLSAVSPVAAHFAAAYGHHTASALQGTGAQAN